MKIHYLFSKRDKLASRIISWAANYENLGLSDNPSHVAILLNEKLVVESTFCEGVRIIPYRNWLDKNIELYKIPCPTKYRPSDRVLAPLIDVWGKGYDWNGILYFAYCYLMLIWRGEPLPAKNKWQRDNKYFCSEYAGLLSGEDLSMKSPARICAEWLES